MWVDLRHISTTEFAVQVRDNDLSAFHKFLRSSFLPQTNNVLDMFKVENFLLLRWATGDFF